MPRDMNAKGWQRTQETQDQLSRGIRDPKTLSGIPRVAGVPPETASQHIRNALMLLYALQDDDAAGRADLNSDLQAVIDRLERAVRQLEAR